MNPLVDPMLRHAPSRLAAFVDPDDIVLGLMLIGAPVSGPLATTSRSLGSVAESAESDDSHLQPLVGVWDETTKRT